MPLQTYNSNPSHCQVWSFRDAFAELVREFFESYPGRRIVRIVPQLVRFGVELILSLSIVHRSSSGTATIRSSSSAALFA